MSKSKTAKQVQPISPFAQHCENPTRRLTLEAAMAYVNSGVSIIPIVSDGSKSPATEWSPYQEQLASKQKLTDWLFGKLRGHLGIAAIGGAVSGGLEILDIDSAKYVRPWEELVEKAAPGLLGRLVFVETPRPGRHAYYRCPEFEGSQKLACVPVTDKKTGKLKAKVIIETRGEGGYAVTAPSPAACHPTGRHYKLLHGKDLTMIPTITPDERAVLLDAARALNTWRDSNEARRIERRVCSAAGPQSGRPGDDFNARGDWHEILEPHGWTLMFVGKDGTEYWRRPGKRSGGASATVNHDGLDLLYVFSSNAHPFDAQCGYSKFSAYALLEHEGDYKAAALTLSTEGFGSRLPRHLTKRGRRKPGPLARYSEYLPPPGWKKK